MYGFVLITAALILLAWVARQLTKPPQPPRPPRNWRGEPLDIYTLDEDQPRNPE